MADERSLRPLGGEAPLLLDAAMGTALIARGLDVARDDSIRWTLSQPEAVRAVHRGHARAGARLALTCTFGGRPPSGAELEAALRLAREGGAPRVGLSLWAGLDPAAIGETVRAAARSARPPDLVWLETATSASQAERALAAALEAAARGASAARESSTSEAPLLGLPVAITVAFTALGDAGWPALLSRLGRGGAAAAGLNCSPWPAAPGGLAAVAARAAEALGGTGCALVLKPDAGTLNPDAGPLEPAAWAAALHEATRSGARLVGGCCGTGDAHLSALAALLERDLERDAGSGRSG